MRHLFIFFLVLVSSFSYGQACKMPASLDDIKPERCGIRYVTSDGELVKVILEFEKKTRIITPNNPNDVKGRLVNLIGLYYLTYDAQGEILEEKKVFVQTGEVPDRGLVFGLNGQRGDLLENDLHLISLEEYKKVPYGGLVRTVSAKTKSDEKSLGHYETELTVEKNYKLKDLSVAHWKPSLQYRDSLVPSTQTTSLEMYDSCTKKNYWTNLYLPTTDPRAGYTLALLNQLNRDVDKNISEKRFRLVSLDTLGNTSGQHDFDFPSAMEVAYRNEIYTNQDALDKDLEKQIWVLKSKDSGAGTQKLGQYYFYNFNKFAELQTSALVVSKHAVFDINNVCWLDNGALYMSNSDYEIISCYIGNDGKHNVYSTAEKLSGLKTLINSRKKGETHSVRLSLYAEPEKYDDGTVLMVYKVEENVGIGAALQIDMDDALATKVNHGFALIHVDGNGRIKATGYYQRPENADPRAPMLLGPIERDAKGTISFYATERTSEGVYPILCNIKRGEVSFVKNVKGNIAAKQIYYDSDQQIVSYFGAIKDPSDPRVKIRTLEVLRSE